MREIGKILSYSKHFKKYYFFLSASIILIGLLSQAVPLLTKQIVDVIVSKIQGHPVDIRLIFVFLGLILLTDVANTVLRTISQYLGDILAVKLNAYLSKRYYRHVLQLSIDYFDNEITGKIVARLERGINNITNLIQQSANNFLPLIITTLITLIIIAHYSLLLAFLLLILFPIYIFISQKSSNAWGEIETEKNSILDHSRGRVFEAISSIRVVKSFIGEIFEFNSFAKTLQKTEGLTRKQSREWHVYDFYRQIVLNLIIFGIFAYVIYFTFQGRYTIGEMTLLLQFTNQARMPLFSMSFLIGQLKRAQAGSKDFFDVLETPIKIQDSPKAQVLKEVKGDIEYRSVSFSYNQDSQVLKDISFNLPHGQKLAIVGESGEGKSTIANLLLRFYEPQSGEIKIDGINISNVTQLSLREKIGVVFQDTFLFSGSILDNIRYVNENATKADVIEAAKIANAHDFISKLPKGYDTEIGERGIRLSGGQKQRIAIARALLKNPPILIFDEATSSLDSKAEFEVQKALNRLMLGRTTLIIAHRLSTIRNVDYIIVIKQGQIIEQGSPDELVKQNGLYAELLSYQDHDAKREEELKELNIEEI